MRLLECVIASKNGVLLKNRDRAYFPHLYIYRVIQPNSEIVFLYDSVTGWAEGMNSNGVAIVNSALIVQRDEREHKIARAKGKKSDDGKIIVEALKKKSIKDILDTILYFKGGLQGHTFINYKGTLYKIEKIPDKYSIRKSKSGKFFARTNHGIDFPNEGYASGIGYLSTRYRLKQTLDKLKDSDPEEWHEEMKIQKYDPSSTLNVVRDSKLFTSSQLLLDVKKLTFDVYVVKKKALYMGLKTVNKGNNPDRELIKISVTEFTPKHHRDFDIKD